MPHSEHLKSLHILRQNVNSLLGARKESASLLAQYLGFKHRSSMTKFLKNNRAGFEMWRLDKLADFFGLPVYQLFQPGISRLTERRSGFDRRTGQERRVGHAGRLLSHLQEELNKVPRLASTRGADQHGPRAVPPALSAIVADFERKVAAFYAAQSREQDASPRRKIAGAPKTRRSPRGSDAEAS